jgi:hypothetical protein
MNHLRARLRAKFGVPVLTATALACVVSVPWSDTNAQPTPPPSINIHLISSGASQMRSNCFRVSGTIGQAAPGYSSGGGYSVLAGYWPAVSTIQADEIFSNGFEGC